MLDGIELKGRCCVVALGITTDGVKIPLGLWDGSTENATVAVARCSPTSSTAAWTPSRACSSSSTAARRCARRSATSSAHVPVQRCVRHKERNVLDHLPERDRPASRRRLRAAWALDDHELALDRLRRSPASSTAPHPGAAALAARGHGGDAHAHPARRHRPAQATLHRTNPIESMIEIVRRTSRNVKRWQSGDMCLRWTAAGMLEAEQPVPQDHRLPRPRQARHRRRARPRRQARTATLTPRSTTAPEVAARAA